MRVPGPGSLPSRPVAEPVTYLAWGSAIAATVLWLASVMTLLVVTIRGSNAGNLLLGMFVQLFATAFATPVLWFWWRLLLARHRAASAPEPLQTGEEPPRPHLSLGGDLQPPQRW